MQLPTPQDQITALAIDVSEVKGIVAQLDKRVDNLEHGQRELLKGQRWLGGLLITILLANIGTAITIILTLSK